MTWSVLVVGSPSDPRLEATRRSLLGHTDDVVVVDGMHTADARTKAAARARHPVMLCLDPGERIDASMSAAVAAFAASTAATGAVCLRVADGAGARREWLQRLVRRGVGFRGAVVDRPTDASFERFPAIITAASSTRSADALRAEVAATPDDAFARYRLAESLLASDSAAALENGAIALETLPLDAIEALSLVLVVATALERAGRHTDVLGLVQSCAERWPSFTELHLRAGLAHARLGDVAAALQAFETCVALGEDERMPGVVGAGTFLPWFHLGRLAEERGDRTSARAFHGRALAHASFAPAFDRVRALDDLAVAAVPVPRRLFDDGSVAAKDCRHGPMRYFVHDLFIGRALDVYGEWCESEAELLGQLIGRGDCVLDIGANIGTHTIFFGKHVGPTGRVIAIEPQRAVHALLAANMAANELGHVECMLAAADAEVGDVEIPIADPTRACNFGAIAVGEAAARTERVRAVSVDALELPSCALIKIDVEGLELRVLAGATRTIAKHRPVLFVENNTLERSREILRTLATLDYRAYWHIERYYRRDNFFANPVDVFGPYQPEANLVCIPRERTTPVAVKGLLEVSGPDDDFVQAMKRSLTPAA